MAGALSSVRTSTSRGLDAGSGGGVSGATASLASLALTLGNANVSTRVTTKGSVVAQVPRLDELIVRALAAQYHCTFLFIIW